MLLLSPEKRRQSLLLESIFDESGEGSNLITSASTFPETSLVWTE